MSQKRILVTGASGCIGHYISEALIQETEHELYLLVRNPKKLQIDTQARPGVNVVQGDLLNLRKIADLLPTIDTAVLTAAAWGGTGTFDVNVFKTLELMSLLDPARCEQVIYFSTASVLDRHNELLKEAGQLGTDYIRSKFDCLRRLSSVAIAPKTTVLFPTLVLGGDNNKPYSHITPGIQEVAKWIGLIRFLEADGSFHFIHGRDIAQVVRYFVDNPPAADEPHRFVLGQEKLTLNQAVEEVCADLGKKIFFRIPLSFALANVLIKVFNIQMEAWDRFSMEYRHFTYENVINPGSLGLENYCPTLTDVLKIYGVGGN
jgi:nucleoside-diphosphate-sugar epimerase